MEYQKIGDKLTPISKDIQFSIIPVDAEIASIDVFERMPPLSGLVVGIAYMKLVVQEQETRPCGQVLNIYCAGQVGEESGEESSGQNKLLELVTDCSQQLNLNFRPLILTHAEISCQNRVERVFLLSGSDCKIHMYREVPGERFSEESCKEYFPEFAELPSSIIQLVIRKVNAQQRLTAIGLQDGEVKVFQVDCRRNEILREWKAEMDSPVTSLSFFTQYNIIPCPSVLESMQDDGSQSSLTDDDLPSNEINLLMTSALEQAIVYRNVLHSGLSEVLWLPESDHYDIGLCSLAADIDFDGQNEILIGTYGQELLVYKFHPNRDSWLPGGPSKVNPQDAVRETTPASDKVPTTDQFSSEVSDKDLPKTEEVEETAKQRHKSDESNVTEKSQFQRKVRSQEDLASHEQNKMEYTNRDDLKADGDQMESLPKEGSGIELRTVYEPHYELLWQRSFPGPIMRLESADMMGDGLKNLIVLTLTGLHILQPNLGQVSELLISRLQQLCTSDGEMGDEFHQLQSEMS